MLAVLSFHLGLLGLGLLGGLFGLSLAVRLSFRRSSGRWGSSWSISRGGSLLVLLADEATEIGGSLLGLLDTSLGLGSRLAKSSTKDATKGSSISTQQA